MRLVSYGEPGAEQPGALADDDTLVPLAPLLTRLGIPSADMNAVLSLRIPLTDLVEDYLSRSGTVIPVASTRLGPPIPRPGTIIAVGGNYASHLAAISSAATLAKPVLFLKPATSLCGPNDDVLLPPETRMLDYECELAVAIGRGGRRIRRADAYGHVGGYLIANDITARDVFLGDSAINPLFMQVTRGKGYDTFCPTGPWLVTPDEFTGPAQARLRLWVNGELRQDAAAADMTFDVAALIESVSEFCTLRPGDIILTGSPPGVGFTMKPRRYLRDGDTLRLEITDLGVMNSRIKNENDAYGRPLSTEW